MIKVMINNNIELMQEMYNIYENEQIKYNVELTYTTLRLLKTIGNKPTELIDEHDLRVQNGVGVRDILLHFYYTYNLKPEVVSVATSINDTIENFNF